LPGGFILLKVVISGDSQFNETAQVLIKRLVLLLPGSSILKDEEKKLLHIEYTEAILSQQ